MIFRIDGEPAIRALGFVIQHARSEETVIECRPKYSPPSMGPVENMNMEVCGPVRCFRVVAVVGQTLRMDLKPFRRES